LHGNLPSQFHFYDYTSPLSIFYCRTSISPDMPPPPAPTSRKRKPTKPKSLSSGRPPLLTNPPPTLSSKATRTLIRSHHTLQKQKAAALKSGDLALAEEIEATIQKQGGLEKYQRASLLGQDKERGGDSSRVLMSWLAPLLPSLKAKSGAPKAKGAKENAYSEAQAQTTTTETTKPKLTMLEVGALSSSNACSHSRIFAIERIDLNSQSPGIKQQDFMERPLPKLEDERFDIISLSLVLNYVAEPETRGEMLRRTLKFLRSLPPSLSGEGAGVGADADIEGRNVGDEDVGEKGESECVGDERECPQELALDAFFPSLFLVLPAPCVLNSRYLDSARLDAIMNSLGYVKVREKVSNKLVYYLWRVDYDRGRRGAGESQRQRQVFKKTEVRSGGSRNNFAVVLK
jgi:25S rRNA (adenine2142-N1)-methyltransferase